MFLMKGGVWRARRAAGRSDEAGAGPTGPLLPVLVHGVVMGRHWRIPSRGGAEAGLGKATRRLCPGVLSHRGQDPHREASGLQQLRD